VAYACADHRLKIWDHETNEERSRKAQEDIEFKKEALQEDVRLADKGFKYYDELIRDLTESFLAGECIDRNPESVGSSSKALAVLVWTLWKLEKRRDLASPFDRRPEQDLSATRKTSQAKFQLITSKQTNT